MAFPATYVRLFDIFLGFLAKSLHLHPPHERGRERTTHFWPQFHELTGIRHADLRHRTGGAKVTRPILASGFKQTAFLHVASTEVITVKMRAFFTGTIFPWP